MEYVLAYDLGTGGIKTSLYNAEGISLATAFCSCKTYYRKKDFREQKAEDWWSLVVASTKQLLENTTIERKAIKGMAVSGHSLGVVPIGYDGSLLQDLVPIWSDARATRQAQSFFEKIDENKWYRNTGNGFPAELYAMNKILWYKDNLPDVYQKTDKFLGTKDYINYRLTGSLVTDHSYASGSGVFNLLKSRYEDEYVELSGIDQRKLPEIALSTEIVGELTAEAAGQLGLPAGIKIACGGVDNACMAAGAGCIENGNSYTSLGTSSWVAVSSDTPITDVEKRPYVFAHILPGMYVSATAIFSAGNSFRWIRDNLCKNVQNYAEMDRLAALSPLGANRLIFNPSLAGGSYLDYSMKTRGAFLGLDLAHNQSDIIRSVLEGICLNLRVALDVLADYTHLDNKMLIVGGGGKSQFWRQLFADIYNKIIIETSVGEEAGSLGAAAVASVGIGLWDDFQPLKRLNKPIGSISPHNEHVENYEKLLIVFKKTMKHLAEIGELMDIGL